MNLGESSSHSVAPTVSGAGQGAPNGTALLGRLIVSARHFAQPMPVLFHCLDTSCGHGKKQPAKSAWTSFRLKTKALPHLLKVVHGRLLLATQLVKTWLAGLRQDA